MESTELHYVTYDPEEIWKAMIAAYVDGGGDVLYPGDEKEMLLRGVQAIVTQVFAAVDNALRMQTLRYATGEYLDVYGENRNCARLEAAYAAGTVRITFQATGSAKTIAAGTAMTADGDRFYKLAADVTQTGYAQVIDAEVVCTENGSRGNGVAEGTAMQFSITNPAVTSITVTAETAGGQEAEDDDTYRERIRLYGLASVTTGPASQYESAAKAVTSEIIDAKALNLGAGQVGIYLILENEEGADAILVAVSEALNAEDVRPLTDTVTVTEAVAVPYTLNIQYRIDEDADSSVTAALATAVTEYQAWQDNTIGRAFNPDRLTANLYKAGAVRVIYAEGSAFDGGDVEYTEIGAAERCKGTISLAVMAE
ncbi:MAG: baseplate J/gp47 family protein [Eubacteriales bacterium]|nr:baseplate J/gp47 family protein [Eubacteriales bacterium]